MNLDEFIAELEKPIPRHERARLSLRLALHKPRHWRNEVHWRWQRSKRGYAECDVWGLDHYLLTLMIGSLKRLREINHGYPGELTPETWDAIQAEIIAGLEGLEEDFWEATPEQIAAFRKSMGLMATWWFSLWD